MRYLHLIVAMCTMLVASCARDTSFNQTFNAHLSDLWYQGDTNALRTQLATLTQHARTFLADQPVYNDEQFIKALIVPHAAYQYSGAVAATAYQRLPAPHTIRRAIMLAPSHHTPLHGIATLPADGYTTPLGTVSIDTGVVRSLSTHSWCQAKAHLFEKEHSLEIQLPLIQQTLPHARIVPLLVGHIDRHTSTQIARHLRAHVTRDTLVVVSSDFTHFGDSFKYTPFTEDIQRNISELDHRAVATLSRGSYEQWDSFLEKSQATICGANPLRILMSLCEQNTWGPTMLESISYDTSGRQTHNTQSSVSYVALALRTLTISTEEKNQLLSRARATLIQAVSTGRMPLLAEPGLGIAQQPLGLFVTLTSHAGADRPKLRGCMGTLQTDQPLYETVTRMTTAAALHDTRFSPVSIDELRTIRLSLSVLTPARPIERVEHIELGRHGIILQHGNAHAVFLPEVPVEQKWDLPTTLSHLCLKAGISSNAWRSPEASFAVFETIKWSEE